MLTMRRVTKATELKRFKELEGKYHYMGENHSGGDTMRLVAVTEATFRPVPPSPGKSIKMSRAHD